MASESGRVPIGLKELLTIASLIFVAGGAWTLNQFQDQAIAEQSGQITDIQHEQISDDLAQQALALHVESIDEKVAKIDETQQEMQKEQTTMSRELFEQRTWLNSILEEVKKP